jgi:hypothetical protein
MLETQSAFSSRDMDVSQTHTPGCLEGLRARSEGASAMRIMKALFDVVCYTPTLLYDVSALTILAQGFTSCLLL